jgi:hypothetical protein
MLRSSGGLFDIRICCTHAMALVEGGKQEVETGRQTGYSHYMRKPHIPVTDEKKA